MINFIYYKITFIIYKYRGGINTSILRDLEQIGKAAMGKDTDSPESPALYSEYLFIKAIQERKKEKKRKKQQNKKDKKE